MEQVGQYNLPGIEKPVLLCQVDGFRELELIRERQEASELDSQLVVKVTNDPIFMQRFGFVGFRLDADIGCEMYDGWFISQSGYYPPVCLTFADYERLGFGKKVKYPHQHAEIRNPVLLLQKGKKPTIIDGEMVSVTERPTLMEIMGLFNRADLCQTGHYKPRINKYGERVFF